MRRHLHHPVVPRYDHARTDLLELDMLLLFPSVVYPVVFAAPLLSWFLLIFHREAKTAKPGQAPVTGQDHPKVVLRAIHGGFVIVFPGSKEIELDAAAGPGFSVLNCEETDMCVYV